MLLLKEINYEIQVNTEVKAEVKCKNPRCITSIEYNAPQLFYVSDVKRGEYRCQYCEEVHSA